jgi:(p)ppGpp synthase/HD superfamily hydrolase
LPFALRVVYEDGRGILREVLQEATGRGYSIGSVETHQLEHDIRGVPAVAVTLEVRGQPHHEPLTAALAEHPGVLEVTATDLARGAE